MASRSVATLLLLTTLLPSGADVPDQVESVRRLKSALREQIEQSNLKVCCATPAP